MNGLTLQDPPPRETQRRNPCSGFTLIELAIAVAVVFIGVLSLFALITSGLDESGKAVADTQAAMFAESVFNGLGAISQREATNNVGWRQEWNAIANKKPITLPAPVWRGADPTRATNYTVIATKPLPPPRLPDVQTLVFSNYAFRVDVTLPGHEELAKLTTYALRYILVVGNSGQFDLATTGPASTPNVIIPVRLYVWDGQFGQSDTNQALVFYTEFDNPGDL